MNFFWIFFVAVVSGNVLDEIHLLKNVYQQMSTLEKRVSVIKYIHKEKVNYDLMEEVTTFDLYCGSKLPMSCYKEIQQKIYLYSDQSVLNKCQLTKVEKLLQSWKYMNTEYVNLKIVLFEIIATYTNDEIVLEELYNKYISKEYILQMMEKLLFSIQEGKCLNCYLLQT
jgi:hypothetical protein